MEPVEIIEEIRREFPPDCVLEAHEFRGQRGITIDKNNLLKIAGFLYNSPQINLDYLKDLCGVDYHGVKSPRFEIVYHLYSMKSEHMLRLNVPVSEEDPSVDSVTDIWKGANWHERECYDLYGIEFKGHPDLKRILLPDDWEGYPLRKDYPVKGPDEEWPGFEEVLNKAKDFKKFEWNR